MKSASCIAGEWQQGCCKGTRNRESQQRVSLAIIADVLSPLLKTPRRTQPVRVFPRELQYDQFPAGRADRFIGQHKYILVPSDPIDDSRIRKWIRPLDIFLQIICGIFVVRDSQTGTEQLSA